MKQKLFTLFLALVASVSAIYAQSGICGDNLRWTLSNGTLTISGTGAMADYSSYSNATAPWYNYSSSIRSIIISDGVTSIGATAFYGCSKLTSMTIGNGVTSIGKYAFCYCSSLSSITIPNSVTSIEAWAFRDCSSLASITIPNSVTSIGGIAFYGCSSLTSVTIGNSVTSIGYEAFEDCSSLTSVHITDMAAWCEINYENPTSNPLYYARNLYLNGEWVRSFVIPDSATTIGDYAFYNCENVKSVTIGNGVTSIGKYAFYNCDDLTSVIFGNSVTSIGDYAFNCEDLYYNSRLESVVCRAEKPAIISSSTFDYRVCYIGLYVPCGCGDAYRAAEGWNSFGGFGEMEGYSIFTFVNDAKMGTAEVNNRTCKNAQIVATPKPGFRFVQWSDGVVNNPRSIVLTQDTTLIAEFAEKPSYVVEVIYNTDHGTVNGQGTYKEDEEVTLTATANDGYKFHKWSNGVTDNPYTFIVKSDVTLEAKFTSTEGIEEVLDSEVHTTKVLRDGQVLILRNGKTYTMQGQEVK